MISIEQLEQAQLTTNEYRKLSQKYGTYNVPQRRGVNYGNPPPNWKMGESLNAKEIAIVNDLIDDILKTIKR